MRKTFLIIGITLLFLGATFLSSGVEISSKTDTKPNIKPNETPYEYYFLLAEISTSNDFEAVGEMGLIGPSRNIFIWENDFHDSGIHSGKIILDTEKYGIVELGPGCCFSTPSFSGEFSAQGIPDKPLFWKITNLDGFASNIKVYSPEPLTKPHTKQLTDNPLFLLLQKIMQRPFFQLLIN